MLYREAFFKIFFQRKDNRGGFFVKFYTKTQNFPLSLAWFHNVPLGKDISYLLDNLKLLVKNSLCLSSNGLKR